MTLNAPELTLQQTHGTLAETATGLAAVVLHGAIFGFFFSFVCTTMWGLDLLPPANAIDAMQAINLVVRNALFFPAFFLTPLVSALAAGLAYRRGARRAALWFLAGALTYGLGGMVFTMVTNVPMNEALALVPGGLSAEEAAQIWADYSPKWQSLNQIRTVLAGIALAFAGMGLRDLPR